MSFDDLPDDKLYEICETMNDTDLIHFSESQKRVYNVCGNIIQKRKELRLASELGRLHQALEYTMFNKLLEPDISLSQTLSNLNDYFNNYYFMGIGDKYLTYPYLMPGYIKVIELNPIKSTRSDYSTSGGELNIGLADDEKEFFDKWFRFMISDTKYVIGLNPDNSIKIITVPFNVNSFNLAFSSGNHDFADYLIDRFTDYYNIMKNYLK